jgi:hypothetical protein
METLLYSNKVFPPFPSQLNKSSLGWINYIFRSTYNNDVTYNFSLSPNLATAEKILGCTKTKKGAEEVEIIKENPQLLSRYYPSLVEKLVKATEVEKNEKGIELQSKVKGDRIEQCQ